MMLKFLGFIPFLILVVIVMFNIAKSGDRHEVMEIFLGFVFIVMAIGGLFWIVS